jgi:hypothetical protein
LVLVASETRGPSAAACRTGSRSCDCSRP